MSSNSAGYGDAEDDPDDKPGSGRGLPDEAVLAYEANREDLWRIAAVRLRPAGLQANAQDVVQNAVMSLMRNPPTNVESWKALLITTVNRRAIDFMGKKASKHERAADLQVDVLDEPGPLAAAGRSAEDLVVEADELQRKVTLVRESIAELPSAEREVIVRMLYEEETQTHIAHAMGKSKGRISQLKKSALTRLSAILEAKGVHS